MLFAVATSDLQYVNEISVSDDDQRPKLPFFKPTVEGKKNII
jgi:hypothetical protein